jgi:DNA-binding transcriptional regulator LsrR (DeoR family)
VDAGKTAVRVKTVSETKVCTELGRVKQRAYVQRQAAEVAGRKIAAMLIRTVSTDSTADGLLEQDILREDLMKGTAVFVMLVVVSLLRAQLNEGEYPSPPRSQKGQLTAQGCVSRSSGYYILMQSGNSYALEASRKIDFGHYLGKQVEVTGRERATLSTSSSRRDAPGLTIVVDSINTISKQCAH